jgi:hypothetical protein
MDLRHRRKVRVLPNPTQADALERIMLITPTRNRLVVAAAYLSVPTYEIFSAAGMSKASFMHYTSRASRARHRSIDGMVYVNLAQALGVPVMALIGDGGALLDEPSEVLDLPVSVRMMTGAWETPEDAMKRTANMRGAKRRAQARRSDLVAVGGGQVVPIR